VTRHRWINHHVTAYEAALYMAEIARAERIEEYQRQKLYEVINRSAGGEFTADRSLLEEPAKKAAPATKRQQAQNWLRLASLLGCDVPAEARERLLNARDD